MYECFMLCVCVYVRMYIYVCVCMYICMYVRTYVCVYVCIYLSIYYNICPCLAIISFEKKITDLFLCISCTPVVLQAKRY